MHVLLRKARRNCPHKNKANVICLVFVWTVTGALRNNACKQNKVSAIVSLMCKSYKLCHLPAFCVEPSKCQQVTVDLVCLLAFSSFQELKGIVFVRIFIYFILVYNCGCSALTSTLLQPS